jgi:hypothetical protein
MSARADEGIIVVPSLFSSRFVAPSFAADRGARVNILQISR